MSVILKSERLVVGYERAALLPELSFSVHANQVWALIGANGSGKTTVLKTLLGLLPAVDGRVVQKPGLRIGYVPQRYGLDLSVPSRVIDVVRQGLDHGWSFLNPLYAHRHKADVQRALRDTDTERLARAQFSKLSEGQKQRVLIARAIVSNPELLVLDEPTSAMDVAAERQAFELIAELQNQRALAVVLVSHHLPVVSEFASHAVYVDRDAQVVIPGEFETVSQSPACLTRYGNVLTSHARG